MKKTAQKTETTQREPICYGRVYWRDHAQERYCTMSRDAGRRGRQLRAAGFGARAVSMGEQVTGVGRVRMTLVNVSYPAERIGDYMDLPLRLEPFNP